MATTRILTIAVDDACDVDDSQITELIHRLIPGSHTLDDQEILADLTDFEWDDDGGLPLPLDEDAARALMNEDGDITLVVTVDKSQFLVASATDESLDAEDEHDLVHAEAFTFGQPHGSELEVVATSGDDFVVSYTTNIAEVL